MMHVPGKILMDLAKKGIFAALTGIAGHIAVEQFATLEKAVKEKALTDGKKTKK